MNVLVAENIAIPRESSAEVGLHLSNSGGLGALTVVTRVNYRGGNIGVPERSRFGSDEKF